MVGFFPFCHTKIFCCHGTCCEFAQSIEASGFRANRLGRAGTGVYFWIVSGGEAGQKTGRMLAEVWYRNAYRNPNPQYNSASNRSFAAIFATVKVRNSKILNFEEPEIQDDFIAYYNKIVNRVDKVLTPEEKNRLKENWLLSLDDEGVKFDVIKSVLELPLGKLQPLSHVAKALRTAPALIVRNTGTIEKLRVEITNTEFPDMLFTGQ